MNKVISTCFILLFLVFSASPSFSASSGEPAPLLPESLAARSAMAASLKTTTVFIEVEEPEKAVVALNVSNDEYAKKGWTVFSILPYQNSGDFRGFFVTYQKKLILE